MFTSAQKRAAYIERHGHSTTINGRSFTTLLDAVGYFDTSPRAVAFIDDDADEDVHVETYTRFGGVS